MSTLLQRAIFHHPKAMATAALCALYASFAAAIFIGNNLLRHHIFNTDQRTAVDSAKDVAVDLAVWSALLLSITTLIYAGKAVSSSNCSIFKSQPNDLTSLLETNTTATSETTDTPTTLGNG